MKKNTPRKIGELNVFGVMGPWPNPKVTEDSGPPESFLAKVVPSKPRALAFPAMPMCFQKYGDSTQ